MLIIVSPEKGMQDMYVCVKVFTGDLWSSRSLLLGNIPWGLVVFRVLGAVR